MLKPTFAVLFKCHYWDDFTQRQLERIKQRVSLGDVFVIVNDTDGRVEGIGHPEDRIFRITETQAREVGLHHAGQWPMLWLNNDYHLHLFTRKWPNYNYYVMLEFDVVVGRDLDPLVQQLSDLGVDFLGEPIQGPLGQWPWTFSCDGSYKADEVRKALICLTIYSNRAAHLLYEKRVEIGRRLLAGEIKFMPCGEAAVPTEVHLAGFKSASLSDFGSTTFYDWAPPLDEAALPAHEDEAFIHPMLDTRRFLAGAVKFIQNPRAFLDEQDLLRRRFSVEGLKRAWPHVHARLWERGDDEGCRRVVELMRLSEDDTYLRSNGLIDNQALGKPASQSSLSQWSLRDDEAQGAVNGPVSGAFTFHTAFEHRPWWKVDLLMQEEISSIRVFNRMENRERANHLEVYVSEDGRSWTLIGGHEGDEPFGGADGDPLEVPVNRKIRFVKLEIPREAVLHLDQVHVLRGRSRPPQKMSVPEKRAAASEATPSRTAAIKRLFQKWIGSVK